MFATNDGPHMQATGLMMEFLATGEISSGMASRRAEFDALEELLETG